MADATPRLVVLPVSPWSERARWALEHHGIRHEVIVHVPVLGERRLRRLVGAGSARVSAPALLLPDQVLRESWDIVCYADRHGAATPLIPEDRSAEVRAYRDLADRTMTAARPLVLMGLLASPEALDETFPPRVPRWLCRLLRPVAHSGTHWFARKYGVRLDDEHTPLAALRAALATLRERLASASPYLLGSFSYADILMMGLLQGVAPVSNEFIPLGPATRRVWSRPAVAAEFSDLVAWRDALYARHRRPAEPPAVARGQNPAQ